MFHWLMFWNLLPVSITFHMLLSPSIGFYAMFSEFSPSLSYLILSYLILSLLSDLLLASWVLVLGWLQISKRLSSCATMANAGERIHGGQKSSSHLQNIHIALWAIIESRGIDENDLCSIESEFIHEFGLSRARLSPFWSIDLNHSQDW